MLSTPFPSWINKWANFYFLLAIVSPLALLFFIKQPVYEQTSFTVKGDVLIANISNQAAQQNAVGDKVQLKLNNHRAFGYITNIAPDAAKRSYIAQIYCSQLNGQSGYVSFRKSRVSIIKKIFN